jgi:hypothetical protein
VGGIGRMEVAERCLGIDGMVIRGVGVGGMVWRRRDDWVREGGLNDSRLRDSSERLFSSTTLISNAIYHHQGELSKS